MAQHIVLVEDDRYLRQGLQELLTGEGYQVEAADTAARADALMLTGPVDLVVLDVGLPDTDGVTLCKRWRETGFFAPVLFLTARDEEMDIVRGLDAGGNDYVTKPFRMLELLSRIRALLRGSVPPSPHARGFDIDETRMTVKQDGHQLNLTLTEYKLLTTLVGADGIVTRSRLLSLLWDQEGRFIDDNTLSVHMSRLREKLRGDHIRTIRGVGYQWLE